LEQHDAFEILGGLLSTFKEQQAMDNDKDDTSSLLTIKSVHPLLLSSRVGYEELKINVVEQP